MQEGSVTVRVKIDEEIIERNVSMVFHSRNPALILYNKWIRLYCKTEEEAKTLGQQMITVLINNKGGGYGWKDRRKYQSNPYCMY